MCALFPSVLPNRSLVDADGQSITETDGIWDPSSSMETPGASMAAVTFKGEDGSEEMHVFFAMAWFHMESWAWAHYLMEWATQGVFQVRVDCLWRFL